MGVHLITLSRMILFPLVLSVLTSANFVTGLPVDSTFAAMPGKLLARCSFPSQVPDCSAFEKLNKNNDWFLKKGEWTFIAKCDTNGDEQVGLEEAMKCPGLFFGELGS